MKKVRQIIWGICAVFLSDAVYAEGESNSLINEIKFGVLKHDAGGLWSGSHKEDGLDYNLEVAFSPSYDWASGTIRPVVGVSINSDADTSKIYLDGRWKYRFDHPGYLTLGLGLAVHDGENNDKHDDTKALGTSILFHSVIEYGYNISAKNSVSLFFDHVSNASFNDDNEGLDTFGLRIGHQF